MNLRLASFIVAAKRRGWPGQGGHNLGVAPRRNNIFLPLLIVVAISFVLLSIMGGCLAKPEANYSRLENQLAAGEIAKVTLKPADNAVLVTPKKGRPYQTGYLDNSETELLADLRRERVAITVEDKSKSIFSTIGPIVLMLLIFAGIFLIFSRLQSGGVKGVMNFAKSKARRHDPSAPRIKFKDVAGCSEAIEELEEIKDFLAEPQRFMELGAKIPKGVLLYGPPGTGKTLLARAVAGEAGVPFFSISGSDFVEMFVGVGAGRVRDLFKQAKDEAPCIIFIDEIDAVGRHRGAGVGGGHDEREQTLNQMLVEMDGFTPGENVIVIAATNRPDILDPALLRPGRFDRQIAVDRPDRQGREAILAVHSKGKPMSPDVRLDKLAGQTPGFTGADLANLVNEAAILAARHHRKIIENSDLEEAIMRVIAGPQRHSRILSASEQDITAAHEMGHALVGHFLDHTDPVHKITITGRGQALGLTVSLPEQDILLVSRNRMLDQMAMILAGRAAEELLFDDITGGASNDLEKVTETARQMITRLGMSESLGLRVFGHDQSQPFLGREMSSSPDYSDKIAEQIDQEIKDLVDQAYQRAYDLLSQKRELLLRLSAILISQETIAADEFILLVEGQSEDEVYGPLEVDVEPSALPPVETKQPLPSGEMHALPEVKSEEETDL